MNWKDWHWKEIFISLIIGAALSLGLSSARRCYRVSHPMESHQKTERLLKKFSSKLDLTADQRTKVAAILEAKRQKMEELRAQVHPQFESLRNSTRDEIKSILNADQQKKFDVLDAKMRSRWKRP